MWKVHSKHFDNKIPKILKWSEVQKHLDRIVSTCLLGSKQRNAWVPRCSNFTWIHQREGKCSDLVLLNLKDSFYMFYNKGVVKTFFFKFYLNDRSQQALNDQRRMITKCKIYKAEFVRHYMKTTLKKSN